MAAETAPAVDEAALEPGTLVGEYRIVARLGEGGMGRVYSGEHPIIGKKVAVKVLHAGLSDDAGMVQRFVQEARAVNRIGHRNIIDVFAFGQLPSGRHYFVMELLPGRSLAERLRGPSPLSYEESFAILLDVCAALAAAHAEGIVHRDLKPDNVYIAETRDGDQVVKLLDFGIAKLLRVEEDRPERTRTGVPVGTPRYMAPEQCLGAAVDARADVYAIGVVMYEMFTGRVPFPGPSYLETMNGHISGTPPRPTELVDIPAPLEALILACLEKDVAARVQTIGEVRERLTAIARDLGAYLGRRTLIPRSSAEAPTPARRTPVEPAPVTAPVPSRRSPAVWAGGALTVAAAIAVVGAFAWRGARGGGERAAAAATAAPAAIVELQVLSEPAGVIVTIDGQRQALRTPSTFRVPRAPTLAVLLEKDGYQPRRETVTLAAGETQRAIEVRLEPVPPAAGRIQVQSNARSATWRLDGREVGDGGGALALGEVAPGPHRLSVEAAGFRRREEELTVKAGETLDLRWTLVAATARRERREAAAVSDDDGTTGWPLR